MKLSEIKGERALDVIADLIDPISEIFADEAIRKAAGGNKLDLVKIILKGHKKSIIEILAILDGEDPKTYEVSLISLPAKILELLNDPELASLFGLQGQTGGATSSTSVLENAN